MSEHKVFGYIRVSTVAQSVDRQVDSLRAAGVDDRDTFEDKISGARQSRPGLDDLLSRVRPGDTITVSRLDRLGRTAVHVLTTIADLSERGITIRSLKPGEDLTGTTGKLMAGIMVLLTQWEREMNSERVAEARAARAARAQAGEQVAGRPRTALIPASVKAIKALRASGMSAGDIAKTQGVSRASVYRALSA